MFISQGKALDRKNLLLCFIECCKNVASTFISCCFADKEAIGLRGFRDIDPLVFPYFVGKKAAFPAMVGSN